MLVAAGLLLLIGSQFLWGELQKQAPDLRTSPPQEKGSAVTSGPPNVTVFNQARDFWAINYGRGGIAFFWTKEPPKIARIIIYRQNPITNKWQISINAPVGPDLPRDLVDAIDGTQGDIMYRMDALSSRNQVLKHYQPVLVPKYTQD
jgi:hypothetical protein